MKVGLERRGAEAEASRGAGDGLQRGGGRVGDEGGAPAEPEDLGRDVVGRMHAPGRPGVLVLRRDPQGLAGVEITPGPVADPVFDDTRPVDAAVRGRQVGDRRQRPARRARPSRQAFQRRRAARARAVGRSGERPGEVRIADGAVVETLQVPASRHGDRSAADAPQAGAGAGEGLAGLAEIRIDRHLRGQRPQRRNLPARGVDDCRERRGSERIDVFLCLHGILLLDRVPARERGGPVADQAVENGVGVEPVGEMHPQPGGGGMRRP